MDELCLLGASEPMITMVLDNLESTLCFPNIRIINNLNEKLERPYSNPRFQFFFSETVTNDCVSKPFMLGVNKVESKVSIIEEFKIFPLTFINTIHKSSELSSTITIGNGVLINSLVSIASFAVINDFVTINRNASIGHHTVIGSFATINPGANIAGFVNIGEKTSIGMGANILDSVRIGKHCIIGAGSLVTKDIPDGVIAYGVPCKIIGETN